MVITYVTMINTPVTMWIHNFAENIYYYGPYITKVLRDSLVLLHVSKIVKFPTKAIYSTNGYAPSWQLTDPLDLLVWIVLWSSIFHQTCVTFYVSEILNWRQYNRFCSVLNYLEPPHSIVSFMLLQILFKRFWIFDSHIWFLLCL